MILENLFLGTKRLRHVVYIMENYYVIPIKGAFMW